MGAGVLIHLNYNAVIRTRVSSSQTLRKGRLHSRAYRLANSRAAKRSSSLLEPGKSRRPMPFYLDSYTGSELAGVVGFEPTMISRQINSLLPWPLGYTLVYICFHSSSLIFLISETLEGKPYLIQSFRIELSLTPN